MYNNFVSSLISEKHKYFMHLRILPNNLDLVEIYKNAALAHNTKIINNSCYYDSGFDIYFPDDKFFPRGSISNKIDFQIKCSASIVNIGDNSSYFTGYYLYSRSSIIKTSLRLANNQGIIDAGYRGSIIGVLDNISQTNYYEVKKGERLLQLCAPNLMPIFVEVVTDLGSVTNRGEGGFGSTGV